MERHQLQVILPATVHEKDSCAFPEKTTIQIMESTGEGLTIQIGNKVYTIEQDHLAEVINLLQALRINAAMDRHELVRKNLSLQRELEAAKRRKPEPSY